MAENRIAAAYVELATRGFNTVLADIKRIGDSLKTLPEPKVKLVRVMEEADRVVTELRSKLENSDLRIKLRIQQENAEYLTKLKADLEKLPREKRIQIIQEQIRQSSAIGGNADLTKGLQGMLRQQTGLAGFIGGAVGPLKAFGAVLDGIQQKLQAVAGQARVAFAGVTGSILAGVAVASPGHFEQLTYALKLVSAEIGIIFLPLIRQITDWLLRLATWIDNLSESQRKQILWWTKAGLAVAVFAMILPKVIAALQAVMTGIKVFMVVLNALLVSNPAGWVITVVAAIGLLVVGLVTLVSAFTQTGDKASGVFGLMKKLFGVLMAVVKPFVDLLMKALQDIMNQLDAFADTFSEVFDQIMEIIGPALAAMLAVSLSVWGEFFKFMLAQLNNLLTSFLALAVVIKRVLTMNFSGMMDEIDAVLSRMDSRLAQRRAAQLQNGQREQALPAYAAPKYSGIAEAAQRIQESVRPDPGEEARQRDAARRNQLLEKIADNTTPKDQPWADRAIQGGLGAIAGGFAAAAAR